MIQITKILIANRGEIALRVMRTAKAMGIKTVAVYSDVDAKAPHVKFADQAVHIGPSPVGKSYLRADKVIEAAQTTGANAIHPGYGFLSENADFAKACDKADIIFIGPPVKAIDIMGDKAKSKRAMIKAGVPCIPGYQGEDQSDAVLIKESKSIGFPLMVKAAAGGGGRGMRLVNKEKDLADAIRLARSEAENAFGSGELIIEKTVIEPRHVEIQVFADQHGNTIHLGERDCSVQRRHQKVIEESPCPVMTPKLRAAMGEAAINTAKAVDYIGAGTVEFLLDADGNFYFLEMNTRLQVEHPVTEMVTKTDLVAMQIKAAQGEALDITQDDVSLSGHAIEVRLYAEDAENDFLPSTGPIYLWTAPNDIRVDSGIETGGEVSPFYDSMVAKIISHGATREEARKSLVSALSKTALVGPNNNRDFLINALEQETFIKGEATTAFIAQTYGEDGFVAPEVSARNFAIAATTQHLLAQTSALQNAVQVNCELLNWTNAGTLTSVYIYEEIEVRIRSNGENKFIAAIGDTTFDITSLDLDQNRVALIIDSEKSDILFQTITPETISITTPTHAFQVTNLAGGISSDDDAGGGGIVRAPMHGQLLDVFVSVGDTVKTGDKLAVLEAMKMQHEILAEIDGTVTSVSASANTQIAADDLILEIEANEGSA